MMPTFNAANWYWIVAGSTTQVFSSAVGDYVSLTDPTYTAWLVGNAPTKIDTEQSLMDVLSLAGLTLPVNKIQSDAAKTAQLNAVDAVVFKILFNHENRIRALEAKAAITAAQFKAAVKALL